MDLSYEKNLFAKGIGLIAGVDEAGRGPLAGPVVAACVVVGADFVIPEELSIVRDSKKLTEKKREALFEIIKSSVLGFGIGITDHETIDRVNILQATFLSMKKALGALRVKPDLLLVDGKFPIPNLSTAQEPVVHGDDLVFSIACASILAKVTRDRIMLEAHAKWPVYGFDQHKGYGTKMHLEAIQKYGPCLIHRKSFAGVK